MRGKGDCCDGCCAFAWSAYNCGIMMTIPLNDKQLDLLRYLYRQTGPALSDHLDGRVGRALRSRGMVEEKGGWLTLTAAGRARRERVPGRPVRSPQAEGGSPRQARAEAII